MAQAIVTSSLSSLNYQRRRLLIAICVVPSVAFLPRAGYLPHFILTPPPPSQLSFSYGILVLISGLDVSQSSNCGVCGACQSLGWLSSVFDKNTPEMQVTRCCGSTVRDAACVMLLFV